MKAFVAVLAVLLVVFGASIIYFRGDFNVGQKRDEGSVTSNQKTGSETGTVTTGPIATETKYTALEIQEVESGKVKVGQSRTLKAVAKDEAGATVSVNAAWTLSSSNVGNLVAVSGAETRFVAKNPGKVKLVAGFKDLKVEKEIEVTSGAVAGATTPTTTTSPQGSGTTTTTTTVYGVGTSAESSEVKPYAIYLYDPTGARFNIGDSRVFTSQVQYNDNSFKTPDLSWSVEPSDLGSLDRTKGSSVTFKANRSGSGTLKATLGDLSASLYLQIN